MTQKGGLDGYLKTVLLVLAGAPVAIVIIVVIFEAISAFADMRTARAVALNVFENKVEIEDVVQTKIHKRKFWDCVFLVVRFSEASVRRVSDEGPAGTRANLVEERDHTFIDSWFQDRWLSANWKPTPIKILRPDSYDEQEVQSCLGQMAEKDDIVRDLTEEGSWVFLDRKSMGFLLLRSRLAGVAIVDAD